MFQQSSRLLISDAAIDDGYDNTAMIILNSIIRITSNVSGNLCRRDRNRRTSEQILSLRILSQCFESVNGTFPKLEHSDMG